MESGGQFIQDLKERIKANIKNEADAASNVNDKAVGQEGAKGLDVCMKALKEILFEVAVQTDVIDIDQERKDWKARLRESYIIGRARTHHQNQYNLGVEDALNAVFAILKDIERRLESLEAGAGLKDNVDTEK